MPEESKSSPSESRPEEGKPKEMSGVDVLALTLAKILDKNGSKIVEKSMEILEEKVSRDKELEKIKEEHWYSTVKWTTILAGILLAIMGILSYVGKMSSDAIAFLLGTVAGYLFSILGNLVGRLQEKDS